MKSKKAAIVAAIGITAVLGLTACGGSSDSTPAPAASSAAPSAQPTVEASPSAEPTTSETPAVETPTLKSDVTVAPGGYFNVTLPKDFMKVSLAGGGDLKFERNSSDNLASFVPFGFEPTQGTDIAGDIDPAVGSELWQAGNTPGTTTITLSYVNPDSGKKVESTTVVVIQ